MSEPLALNSTIPHPTTPPPTSHLSPPLQNKEFNPEFLSLASSPFVEKEKEPHSFPKELLAIALKKEPKKRDLKRSLEENTGSIKQQGNAGKSRLTSKTTSTTLVTERKELLVNEYQTYAWIVSSWITLESEESTSPLAETAKKVRSILSSLCLKIDQADSPEEIRDALQKANDELEAIPPIPQHEANFGDPARFEQELASIRNALGNSLLEFSHTPLENHLSAAV